MGIGDWGLGIGDWGLGPIPNPQSPIPILIIITNKDFIKFNFIYYLYFYVFVKLNNKWEDVFSIISIYIYYLFL